MQPGDNEEHEDEQFEHIPWARLEAADQKKKFFVYAAAAALVAGGLSASITRSLSGRSADPADAAVPTPSAPAVVITTTSSTTSTSVPLSEADLMAVDPHQRAAAAAARAEWFVADFFTLDGSQAHSEQMAAMFPGARRPTDEEGRSFVEWARAVEVEQIEIDRYRVVVVVRSLSGVGEQPYQRIPPRAVEVVVELNDQGAMVVDLPAPASLPSLAFGDPHGETGPVPESITAAALELVGEEGVVLSAGKIGEGFRVVVAVTDEAGLSWPLALWLNAAGEQVATGSLDPGF